MNNWIRFSLLAALAAPTSLALAQPNDEIGFYAGASYGLLKVKGDDEFDDDQDAYQLLAGATFHKYFGVEGSYIDFGSYGGNLAKADVDGFTLAVKGILPVTDFFSVYAKGGQLWWDADYDVLTYDGGTDGDELFWGLGVAFSVAPQVDITLDYTRYNVEFERDEIGLLASDNIDTDTDLDHASAGIVFRF
ncbi:MAG: outer membrane beta-barrel protein [Pseudomonadota bacterium]|nr:cell envelope biogenesis protein OmpA [Pseudomonadales bacterium]MDY6919232.1 outer membrane beta-barrel protein [Pseudomonadota bacterium]